MAGCLKRFFHPDSEKSSVNMAGIEQLAGLAGLSNIKSSSENVLDQVNGARNSLEQLFEAVVEHGYGSWNTDTV